MNRYAAKIIICMNIMVIMLFIGTSCYKETQPVDNKEILSSMLYDKDDKAPNINDEVLIMEQKELYLNSKAQSIYKREAMNNHQLAAVESVPVLMYHSISFEKNNDLRVPKEKFDAQMKYLKENGFHSITMAELYEAINNGKQVPPKPIVITFDDGYVDNYTDAYPILMKYEFKGTIFVITDIVGKGGYINASQIQEMHDNGIDLESHTVYHEELDLLPYDKQLNTLKRSKEYLETALNKKVISVAYPFGKYNSNTIKAAKEAGYMLAFTTQPGFSRRSNGMFTLARVRINASDTTSSFAAKIGK